MTDREAVERAIQLLDVAAEHIQEHSPTQTTFYDDAECDGICLASECSTMATDLAAISAMGAPRVKPLEWRGNFDHKKLADTPFGVYQVLTVLGGVVVHFYAGNLGQSQEIDLCKNMDEAQAASQADYEARVLACLDGYSDD